MIITPDWSLASPIRAISTTRLGGHSQGLYAGRNLAQHVGDDRHVVQKNREELTHWLGDTTITWLNQVHGVDVVCLDEDFTHAHGDAVYTRKPGGACAVLSADCLPVLLADAQGDVVAAVHCGWRSLSRGILVNTLAKMGGSASRIHAWLGPAIGPKVYEVGEEVRNAFMAHNPKAATGFIPQGEHWLANLYHLATQSLQECGVKHITGGEYCTSSDEKRFYSYRRDGPTGRQATLIWLEA